MGLDCFEPFLTRKGKGFTKRYGGTVHIEVAYSFDTSLFIQALRRFIARRGQVL